MRRAGVCACVFFCCSNVQLCRAASISCRAATGIRIHARGEPRRTTYNILVCSVSLRFLSLNRTTTCTPGVYRLLCPRFLSGRSLCMTRRSVRTVRDVFESENAYDIVISPLHTSTHCTSSCYDDHVMFYTARIWCAVHGTHCPRDDDDIRAARVLYG